MTDRTSQWQRDRIPEHGGFNSHIVIQLSSMLEKVCDETTIDQDRQGAVVS